MTINSITIKENHAIDESSAETHRFSKTEIQCPVHFLKKSIYFNSIACTIRQEDLNNSDFRNSLRAKLLGIYLGGENL